MLDMTIHYRNSGSEQRTLPALPPAGSYLHHDGRLWRIDAVVIDAKAVHVHAIEVSPRLAADLLARWAGDPQTVEPYVCDGCGETVNLRPCVVCQALRVKKAKVQTVAKRCQE